MLLPVAHSNPNLTTEHDTQWCGHCKRLAPEYEAAAQTLKRNDPPLYIAKIDATANPKAAKEFEAYRYPTVLFLCGDSTDKVGERQQDGIVNYVISNSIRELPQLESLDDVRTLTAANDVVTIGYFADLDSAAAKVGLASSALLLCSARAHSSLCCTRRSVWR